MLIQQQPIGMGGSVDDFYLISKGAGYVIVGSTVLLVLVYYCSKVATLGYLRAKDMYENFNQRKDQK